MDQGRRPPLTDDEAREIARRLIAERGLPLDDCTPRAADVPPGGTTPEDEDRIERALVALGYLRWETTAMAERGEPAPQDGTR